MKEKISEETEVFSTIPKEEKVTYGKISIIYDNYEYDSRLKTAWGFSCLLEIENKSILFDTGAEAETLLGNMEKLGINPREINLVVLSHIHGDHVGGLKGFLERNNQVTVYIPHSFPNSFREMVKSYGANSVGVSGPRKIFNSVYTTGELGQWIKEQSLIIDTEKGLIIITGCAHPGVVNIVREAKRLTNESVYLVMGGFHLSGASDTELNDIIESFREIKVKKVAPCHCSGDRARELFKEEYKENYISAGVGKVIEI